MCIHHDYTGIGVIQLYRVYAVSEFGLSDFTASNLFFFDALMTCPSFSLLSFVLDADFEAGDPTPVDPADPADPTDPVSGAFSSFKVTSSPRTFFSTPTFSITTKFLVLLRGRVSTIFTISPCLTSRQGGL